MIQKRLITAALMFTMVFTFGACNDDDEVGPTLNGNNTVYVLNEVGDSGVSGTVTFAELSDGSTTVVVDLNGTSSGNIHPAHIHFNTAAEGGDIAISLEPVDGATGSSSTIVSSLDDGTAITYSQLITFDGYVNVHLSASELETIVAQGDIGQNALTGDFVAYDLNEMSNSGVSGTATFYERLNNETLVVLDLTGTPAEGMHPAHIHDNTAAEGGDIAISLNMVDGATGISRTNVSMLDEAAGGTAINYDDLISYDGYINVHLSESDLMTIVAQGDIGQNALTGESVAYPLNELNSSGVSGTATFYERLNNETLVVLDLTGTPADGMHPAHIHDNTAAEGGGIAISLNTVDGATGMSRTNVTMLDEAAGGTVVTFDDLIAYDGYINVHLSASELETVVAQGDIGQNALTGESVSYVLNELNGSGVSGTATFYERLNNETLVVLELTGTPPTGMHPAHIHDNSAAEGGGIAISLSIVDGATGLSRTNVTMLDEAAGGTAVTYNDLLGYNGHINVHLSESELETVVAQGDVGANG